MKKVNYTEVKAEVAEQGCKNVMIRWLITEKDGAKNFVMRLFEVGEGGSTPYHQHDWEHEVFFLEGKGIVKYGDDEFETKKGDVVFIPPNEWHQFKNIGSEDLKFLCLIPQKK